MDVKYFTIFILFFCSIKSSNTEIQTQNGKIKITVGTTSACIHTINFIAELVPVYEEYKEYLEIEFVPWGRTRIEDGSLVCQFGVNDCWANRLQRCVLDMLKGNQDAQVRYMACEFTRPLPAFETGSYVCAQGAGLAIVDVDYCMSTTGDNLEGPAQEAAMLPMEIIDSVPFIVFNDVVDRSIHLMARLRFKSLICFALADDFSTSITHCSI